MATTITKAQAMRIMQVALFTQANRNRSFVNVLTEQEQAPKAVNPDKPGVQQTSFHAPVVRVTDVQSAPGDSVDMQIIYNLSKKPTMGDRKLAGRGEDMNMASFDIRVQQGRHMVDTGGKMSQKRTRHNLSASARTMLGTYYNTLQDQIATVHLAGARGDFMEDDTILPPASDVDFREIMVNPVMPPTYDRHFFGGDATTLETVESSDIITLKTIDNLALYIDEQSNPIQPVRMSKDELKDEDPYYVLYITPRQWDDFYNTASAKDWQAMASRVINRSKGFTSPLFKGECVMWRNILVRKYGGMPVRFYTGSTIDVSNNDSNATVKQVQCKTTIDRAILLGGQALALAYGASGGGHFNYNEELTDHKNAKEISISWINGLKKIRFPTRSGKLQDNGVIVVDSAISNK